MKAIEQYFPVVTVVLFIMRYKVILTFQSAKEILMREHSTKYSAVRLARGTF